MKRYLLFGIVGYYPQGGWDDLLGMYDTLDEAKAAIEEDKEKGLYQSCDWYQIVDSHTGAKV